MHWKYIISLIEFDGYSVKHVQFTCFKIQSLLDTWHSRPCSSNQSWKCFQHFSIRCSMIKIYCINDIFMFKKVRKKKNKTMTAYCELNYHNQKIWRTPTHNIRKHWTAVSTLLGLISSVYRDLPHRRSNHHNAEQKLYHWATNPHCTQVMQYQLKWSKQLFSVFVCHTQVFTRFSGCGNSIHNIILQLKKEYVHLWQFSFGQKYEASSENQTP